MSAKVVIVKTPFKEVTSRLQAKHLGKGIWATKCPVCNDTQLAIGEGEAGRAMLYCAAGCSNEKVLAALGMTESDLFPQSKGLPKRKAVKAGNEAPKGAEANGQGPKGGVIPRPLGELLTAVKEILRRYVVFPLEDQAILIAIWIAHTWAIEAFEFTPYLNVFSASKRSGKSRVLEVINLLARNPRLTSSGSSAGLLRSIDEHNPPTLLLDEVDAVYGKKNDNEGESLRQFLNAGFRRGATFLRCVGQGANLKPREFPAFCPKALAGIGRCLPDTVLDRSLPIELVRQSREQKAERFREREVRAVLAPVRAELEAWAQQPGVIDALREARPMLPEELNDRAQDITEPLIAIADFAGGEWPQKLKGALVKLCSQEEDADIGVQLLAAIKVIFDETSEDKLTTRQILDALIGIEDGPWALMFEDALKHDKHQTAAAKLAQLLRNYKTPDGKRLKPHTIRVGNEFPKGFYRADFEREWERYLPSTSEKVATSATSATRDGRNVATVATVAPSRFEEDDDGFDL